MAFLVRKARRVTQPTYLHRVADRHVPAVRAVFLTAVERAWAATDPQQLAIQHDFAGNGIAWNVFDAELDRSLDVLRLVVRDAAAAEVRSLNRRGLRIIAKQEDDPPWLTLVLDLLNPEAILFAARSANLFRQNLTQQTQQAIRAIIVRAQQRGLSVTTQQAEIMELLEAVFGLNERQAIAIDNLRLRLVEGGMAEARIAERVRAQAERYLRARALMIARHETMVAATGGQHAIWQQAADNGILAPDQQRSWLAAGDRRVCPICLSLDGLMAPLNGTFLSTYNGVAYAGPPSHISCRCSLSLAFD